jgi:hypothetical protein
LALALASVSAPEPAQVSAWGVVASVSVSVMASGLESEPEQAPVSARVWVPASVPEVSAPTVESA